MACVAPLSGFFSKSVNESGKRSIVFGSDGDLGRPVEVPCGQCIGCRLEYSRSWAVRCMHEASMHEENCFVTLTQDDDHLDGGSLNKKHCQDFLKRLRSRYDKRRIRFYLSGEYGTDTIRPHYHALLFGFDLPDKKYWSFRDGNKVWTSDILEETWGRGLAEIGSVTFESAAYCARYMVQKFKGPKEVVEKYYDGLQPEFALMSRKPGIGFEYYQKFGREIYSHDSVIIDGHEQKPPLYYDRLFEVSSPFAHKALKEERKEKFEDMRLKDGRGDSRLYAEKAILESRVKLREEEKAL